jgi:hypothetical protein
MPVTSSSIAARNGARSRAGVGRRLRPARASDRVAALDGVLEVLVSWLDLAGAGCGDRTRYGLTGLRGPEQ